MLLKTFLPFLALASFVAAQDPAAGGEGAVQGGDQGGGETGAETGGDMGGDQGGDTGAEGGDTGAEGGDPNAGAEGGEDDGSWEEGGEGEAAPSATDGGEQAGPTPAPEGDTGGDPNAGAEAGVSPSAPGGDAVLKPGQLVSIQWGDVTGDWTNMTIALMTGTQEEPNVATVVTEGVDATMETSFTYNMPDVYPYSKVWFFQFSNNGVDSEPRAFTPRFTVQGPDGETIPPPLTETISGSAIGYAQNGYTKAANGATSAQTNTGKPIATGQSGNGVTIYTGGINTGTDLPDGITVTGIKAATDHSVDPSSGKRNLPVLAMVGAAALGATYIMA